METKPIIFIHGEEITAEEAIYNLLSPISDQQIKYIDCQSPALKSQLDKLDMTGKLFLHLGNHTSEIEDQYPPLTAELKAMHEKGIGIFIVGNKGPSKSLESICTKLSLMI